jgi:hypothetical protein
MPWKSETVMDLRIEFVIRALKKETSMTTLCKQFGISRPTGYLWLSTLDDLCALRQRLLRSLKIASSISDSKKDGGAQDQNAAFR